MKTPGNEIAGWMLPVELYWLNETAKKFDTCVEVGSFAGRSSTALVDGINGVLYCVENFKGEDNVNIPGKDIKKAFKSNMRKHLKSGKCVLVELDSLDAAQRCDAMVDMVFIDGSHKFENVVHDIKSWLPNARYILAGHDWDMEEVQKAVKFCFHPSRIKRGFGNIWYVEVAEGVGYVR